MSSDSAGTTDPFYDLRQQKLDHKGRAQIQQALQRQDHRSTKRHPEQHAISNWGCKLDELLPADLKPRPRLANGKPVAITHNIDRKRLPPKRWTTSFRTALFQLSSVTQADIGFAHTKLLRAVRARQAEQSHPLHYARELLKSDIDHVTAEVRRLTKSGGYTSKAHDVDLFPALSGAQIKPKQAYEVEDDSEDEEVEEDSSDDESGGVSLPKPTVKQRGAGPSLEDVRRYLLSDD